jgi:hypothetical protein
MQKRKTTFDHATAVRVLNATRKVERPPVDRTGDRNRPTPQDTQFWAYLSTPGGSAGLHWSWVRVCPVEKPPTADKPLITVTDDLPLWKFAEPMTTGYQTAREANGNRDVPVGTVALLSFVGYDEAGEPLYVFTYQPTTQQGDMPTHDHRDNMPNNGGFAFSCYHPGTGLPQQPWHL